MRNERGQFIKGYGQKKGFKLSPEHKEKFRLGSVGRAPWNKGLNVGGMSGKKHSIETRKKMSETQKKIEMKRNTGKDHHWYGRSMSGNNHPRWIQDRTQVKQYWTERNNPEYKQWRKSVWKRDSFKCRISNEDCKGRLEAHHILVWRNYPELRYKINNGITLCHAHHPRGSAEEKRMVSTFMELLSVSKD